jgi:PAS domain S-box-containing protein
MVVFSATAHQSVTRLMTTVDSISSTRLVLEKTESLFSNLKDVESSARGYAITGKQTHLDPYYLAAKSAAQNLDDLKKLMRDNPLQLKRLMALEPLIQRHLSLMKEMVDLGSKNIFRAVGQSSLSDQGYSVMADIRQAIRELETDTRQLLSEQERSVTARAWAVRYSVFSASVLAMALCIVMIGGLHRAVLSRKKAELKMGGLLESTPDAIVIVGQDGRIITTNSQTERYFGYTRQELLGQSVSILVPERFHQQQTKHYLDYFSRSNEPGPPRIVELCAVHKDGSEFPVEVTMKPIETEEGLLVTSSIRDITRRKRAEEEIIKLNRKVEQRAAEFEAANKELEAFSYSVSHDLRAPLRSIDGFSQALLEDYAARLDAEGKDHLQRVRAGCRHMGEIIDALLVLSRMTRAEMNRVKVELSALAREVAGELRKEDPKRKVDFVIADGLSAEGDMKLLRVVLENLLGNAWKFTAKKSRARIEFGTLPQADGARVYFVRDDGAGFDMAHATKLFTAFKRLHDTNDFPGTGIGLTTVQRVINRHGGKIWAEGAVGKGATFCFTLPTAEN